MGVLKALRGMHEVLPKHMPYWHQLEHACKILANLYGYEEVRFPVLEPAALYQRTVGEASDIVSKEMYAFSDRNKEQVALRPEGTAGCVRMAIEKGLLYNQVQKFWYLGPMFRHERPQAGRYRQFHQFGIEAFGIKDPAVDAEIMLWGYQLFNTLGLEKFVCLELNTLALPETRARYIDGLRAYFNKYKAQLSDAVLARLAINPLRVLDSKDPELRVLIKGAPTLLEILTVAERQHFDAVQSHLKALGVPFRVNPHLVRGLDYYTLTVFEWVTDELGAQSTLCAGGRYDHLVSLLGGQGTPAVGCALGLERIILLLQKKQEEEVPVRSGVYFILLDSEAITRGMILAEALRKECTFPVRVDASGASMRSQFKRAESSGSSWAVVIGAREVADHAVRVKPLGAEEYSEGSRLSQGELGSFFKAQT